MQKKLIAMGACSEAVEWVGNKTLAIAWAECERPDWMLWYAARKGIDKKLIVLAACACARTALKFVPKNEKRPLIAIETAERWVEGKATLDDVRAASYGASYAAISYAAAFATYAAAYAAASAASAASFATYAASVASAVKKSMADLVRKIIVF